MNDASNFVAIECDRPTPQLSVQVTRKQWSAGLEDT